MASDHIPKVELVLELCHLHDMLVTSKPIESLFCTLCVCSVDVLEPVQVRMVSTFWVIQRYAARLYVLDAVEFVNNNINIIC